MLEANAAAVAALKANQQKLAASACRVLATDALKYVEGGREKFDIIFADPPFTSGLMPTLLEKLPPMLLDEGVVYVEWGTPIADVVEKLPVQQWQIAKQGRAGAVHFALLQIRTDVDSTRSGKKT